MTRSKLSLQFDATAMKVTGIGEPAKDVPEVQRVMLSEQVLDVERLGRCNGRNGHFMVVAGKARPDGKNIIMRREQPLSIGPR